MGIAYFSIFIVLNVNRSAIGVATGLHFGASIGSDAAIFEAVHGSAPDIAGQGIANPIALLNAACMMLDYLGKNDVSEKTNVAIDKVLKTKSVLAKDLGGNAMGDEFTNEIINCL